MRSSVAACSRRSTHLRVGDVADWFSSYVYLPKLRDRVVLESAIRDAVGKLDPAFAYADRFEEVTGTYVRLVWAKSLESQFPMPAGAGNQVGGGDGAISSVAKISDAATGTRQPRRSGGDKKRAA